MTRGRAVRIVAEVLDLPLAAWHADAAALRGSAVYFACEGSDASSLHAGLPVQRREKWIATKWQRERPY